MWRLSRLSWPLPPGTTALTRPGRTRTQTFTRYVSRSGCSFVPAMYVQNIINIKIKKCIKLKLSPLCFVCLFKYSFVLHRTFDFRHKICLGFRQNFELFSFFLECRLLIVVNCCFRLSVCLSVLLSFCLLVVFLFVNQFGPINSSKLWFRKKKPFSLPMKLL